MVTTVTDNSPQSINTSLFSLDKEVQEIKKATGKVANALIVNGKTYDGSSAVDAGVQTVANGGTGVTTQEDINRAFIDNLDTGGSDVTDGTEFVSSYASDYGFADSNDVNTPYKRKFIKVWNYIKGKISSVLGLTKDNYGGTAKNATTAKKVANALTVNGKTYDGSSAVDAGVQTVANGGTGASNEQDAFENIASGVRDATTPADNEKMLLKPSYKWYKTTCLDFWNYIKGKISSVLGLTKDNYGGTADKATTAAKLGRGGDTDIPMTFNWIEQGEQPSWLWGGTDGINMYVYNPSKLSVNRASTAGTADKAIEVVDYGDTSRTVKIGYQGPGITANNLLHLAGYTESTGSSVKLKDVNKEELIKWLGIPRIKYADYQIPSQTFTQFQQVPIELSEFSSEVTPNNVLCFMVIYWSGVQLIASADWGSYISSGLKCALISLGAGTGYAIIRCVYMV